MRAIAIVLLSVAALSATQQPKRTPDIHFVPTPEEVVEAMLRLADVGKDDVVYDLGSGDGRIPITAARRFGARGVGIDLDPKLVAQATRSAQDAGVGDRVRFIEGDIFEADISGATVVTLYLLSSINERLRPKLLKELRPGTRIVSHQFRMGDWQPEREIVVDYRPAVSVEDPEAVMRFIARRLLLTVPVLARRRNARLLARSISCPAIRSRRCSARAPPAQDVADLRQRLGLDRPLYVQYAAFLRGAVTGDLGRSLRTGQRVTAAIAERMPATFELAMAAMLFAILVAVPLGIVAAVRAGTAIDHGATTLALIGISIPGFWLGPLLAIVFAVELGWLPVSGRGTPAHLVLPAITLGAPLAAVLARMTRASVLEELRELYVLAARARGVSRTRAVLRHAFRNSLIPIVTVLGLQFGAVLTGAVITETIFAWPGVGRLLIQSITFRDYPLVQGCILLIAVTYVGMNLLTDVVYGLLDPRIRYE